MYSQSQTLEYAALSDSTFWTRVKRCQFLKQVFFCQASCIIMLHGLHFTSSAPYQRFPHFQIMLKIVHYFVFITTVGPFIIIFLIKVFFLLGFIDKFVALWSKPCRCCPLVEKLLACARLTKNVLALCFASTCFLINVWY